MADEGANLVLIGVEAEYRLRNKSDQDAAKIEEKRAALMRALVAEGIPEDMISRMNARELLACDLIFVNQDTSRFLQRPEGKFDIAKLYDASDMLEFRIRPDVETRTKENISVLDNAINAGRNEYELMPGPKPAPRFQVNFSSWRHYDQEGYYSNILDSDNPMFTTAGAATAKKVVDYVATKADHRVAVGVSRVTSALRLAGTKLSARMELRIEIRSVDDAHRMIDGISPLMGSGDWSVKDAAAVTVLKRPVFTDTEFLPDTPYGMKLMRHALNACTVTDDGRLVPSPHYVTLNAGKIGCELGLLKDDSVGFYIKPLLMELLSNARIFSTGQGHQIVFPDITVNTSREGEPKIQLLHGKHGDSLEIGAELYRELGEYNNFAGTNAFAETKQRLGSIKVLAVTDSLSYCGKGSAQPEAYTVSGTRQYPVITLNMAAVPQDRKAEIASYLYRDSISDTKKGDYEIYADGNILPHDLVTNSLTPSLGVQQSGAQASLIDILSHAQSIRLCGDEALNLLKIEGVPPAAIHRWYGPPATGNAGMDTALSAVREQLGDRMGGINCALWGLTHTEEPHTSVQVRVGIYNPHDSHIKQLSAEESRIPGINRITVPRSR